MYVICGKNYEGQNVVMTNRFIIDSGVKKEINDPGYDLNNFVFGRSNLDDNNITFFGIDSKTTRSVLTISKNLGSLFLTKGNQFIEISVDGKYQNDISQVAIHPGSIIKVTNKSYFPEPDRVTTLTILRIDEYLNNQYFIESLSHFDEENKVFVFNCISKNLDRFRMRISNPGVYDNFTAKFTYIIDGFEYGLFDSPVSYGLIDIKYLLLETQPFGNRYTTVQGHGIPDSISFNSFHCRPVCTDFEGNKYNYTIINSDPFDMEDLKKLIIHGNKSIITLKDFYFGDGWSIIIFSGIEGEKMENFNQKFTVKSIFHIFDVMNSLLVPLDNEEQKNYAGENLFFDTNSIYLRKNGDEIVAKTIDQLLKNIVKDNGNARTPTNCLTAPELYTGKSKHLQIHTNDTSGRIWEIGVLLYGMLFKNSYITTEIKDLYNFNCDALGFNNMTDEEIKLTKLILGATLNKNKDERIKSLALSFMFKQILEQNSSHIDGIQKIRQRTREENMKIISELSDSALQHVVDIIESQKSIIYSSNIENP